MKTLKSFVAKSHLSESLIRNVVAQHGGWDNFKESASDITYYGASGGVTGFIYYTETVKFFCDNRAAIKQLAKEQAADCGVSMYEMIAGFNCLNNNYDLDDIVETFASSYADLMDTDLHCVANALAWYALEEVAHSYVSLTE